MNDSIANQQLALPPDAILVPVAASFSGDSIFSLLVRTELNGKTFFTILTGSQFQPTGWAEDGAIIESLVAKHGFVPLAVDHNPPFIVSGKIQEGKKKLEDWWKSNKKRYGK